MSGWVAEPQEVQEGRLTLVNPLVPSSPRHPKRCLDHPAEELKVKISIETVWNNFITTPEQLIEYVDSFHSPWVAAYFDCSNMLKYGVPAATWIRKLGKRMVKFDFKGYHMEKSWCKIGEGSEDWPEVLTALAEIGYDGWATSEVGGGGEAVLKDVAERMKRVLELT